MALQDTDFATTCDWPEALARFLPRVGAMRNVTGASVHKEAALASTPVTVSNGWAFETRRTTRNAFALHLYPSC